MQPLDQLSNSPERGEDCAGLLLEVVPLVMRSIGAEMRRRTTDGLSVPQFRTLAYLSRGGGGSLSEVADHLGLALPSMSKIVDGLVARELVVRQTCAEDRRRVTLTLSESGQRLLDSARRGTQESLARKLDALPAAEREGIARAMLALRPFFLVDRSRAGKPCPRRSPAESTRESSDPNPDRGMPDR